MPKMPKMSKMPKIMVSLRSVGILDMTHLVNTVKQFLMEVGWALPTKDCQMPFACKILVI